MFSIDHERHSQLELFKLPTVEIFRKEISIMRTFDLCLSVTLEHVFVH